MYEIKNVHAREVLDSRWNPTVEVEITLEKWFWRAIVPSWASTWIHEALELRDWDKSRYLWKWVLKAVENVNTTIKKEIVWKAFKNYRELDELLIKLDWTKNKSNLWANAILWVSMAFVVAASNSEWKKVYEYLWLGNWKILPTPMMNIINGWSHADNNVDIQEFMIVPVWATSIKEAVRMWAEVFHNLKKILSEKWLSTSVWDEWWYAPNLSSNEDAIKVILEAISKAWYDTNQIKLALDVASSEFYKDGKYNLSWEGKILSSSDLVKFYGDLVSKYPIISIEDWMAEDDFEGWKELNEKLWSKIMLVWDDLFVTNIERLSMGIKENLANSILIKLNQIWSVSETIDAIDMATSDWMKSIISHRSWETEDTFIAHLVVAKNTWFIKTWSLSRTDRIAKYNELIRIEEYLEK
jgi:enolase